MSARTRETPASAFRCFARKSPSAPVPESWRLPWESRSPPANFFAKSSPCASRMPSETATTQRPSFFITPCTSFTNPSSENGRSGR